MPEFGKKNVVIIDQSFSDLSLALGPSTFSSEDWDAGRMDLFKTESSEVTFTTLPIPYGRMMNFDFQNAILKTADMFVVISNTTHHWENWTEKLPAEFPHIPVVCIFNRFGEEDAVVQWKTERRQAIFGQFQFTIQLEAFKETPLPPTTKGQNTPVSYFWENPFPVTPVSELQKKWNDHCKQFYECEVSRLGSIFETPNQKYNGPEIEKLKKIFAEIKELSLGLEESTEEVKQAKQDDIQTLMAGGAERIKERTKNRTNTKKNKSVLVKKKGTGWLSSLISSTKNLLTQ